MTERQEELAALNAVYSLDAHERQILRAEMRTDPRLRELAAEFEDTAAKIALLLPAEAPPDELRPLLLKTLKQRRRAKATAMRAPFRLLRDARVAWTVAALIALIAWIGGNTRRSLTRQVGALSQSESAAQGEAAEAKGELAGLEKRLSDAADREAQLVAEIITLKQASPFARMEVIPLHATVRRFEECVAFVAWDGGRQEGMLKIEKMPPVQANRSYQLWAIDRRTSIPVNAGVIKVDARGTVSMAFKPAEPVPGSAKFAISIEALGGVAKKSADSQVIFAGP